MHDFSSFVAIGLKNTSVNTYEYKAMKSFADATRQKDFDALEDALKYWLASMIDSGVSAAIRKRYIDKLNAIYREYDAESAIGPHLFQAIKQLNVCYGNIDDMSLIDSGVDRIFNVLMSGAKSQPALAIFLYLLFNASSDVKKAIMLRTDEYRNQFAQLEDVIVPATFHHLRKYVFNLNQSRKREPQLVREVLTEIESCLTSWGIKLKNGISVSLIPAIWIGKAKSCGINLSEIVSVLDAVPAEYGYLQLIRKTSLGVERRDTIKERVANAFAPSNKSWYALKLRRGVSYDNLQTEIQKAFPEFCNEDTFFYPQKEVSRRVDKRIVTEVTPVIPDIVFFHVQPCHVGKIDRLIRMAGLGWIFRTVNTSESDYSVIPRSSMLDFQKMIGVFSSNMRIELTQERPIGVGREVRITGGIMTGYKGMIYDIKEGDDGRLIYIKISNEYSVRAELKIEEHFVEPVERSFL